MTIVLENAVLVLVDVYEVTVVFCVVAVAVATVDTTVRVVVSNIVALLVEVQPERGKRLAQ